MPDHYSLSMSNGGEEQVVPLAAPPAPLEEDGVSKHAKSKKKKKDRPPPSPTSDIDIRIRVERPTLEHVLSGKLCNQM